MVNKKEEAIKIWENLSDVPTDEGDCIEIDFEHFPAGTFREDIWTWLELQFDVAIYELMYTER